MSNEHEIPIGTKLWCPFSDESHRGRNYDYIVVGHKDDGDLLVDNFTRQYPQGTKFLGGRVTLNWLKHNRWYYELPGPRISNKGFAKFIRKLENV